MSRTVIAGNRPDFSPQMRRSKSKKAEVTTARLSSPKSVNEHFFDLLLFDLLLFDLLRGNMREKAGLF